MAYVINPDGTIKLLAVEFDRFGNIRPKKIIDEINPSIAKNTPQQVKKEKSPSENAISSSVPHSDVMEKKDRPIVKYAPQTQEKKKLFQTKEAIDEYFVQRKELHQIVHQEIFAYAVKHISSELSSYFIKCFYEHNDYCRKMGWISKEPEWKPKKKRKEEAFSPISSSSKERSASSRHPVYGYARDRYGRVQERDSFNEERKNEFRKSQSLQGKYDYSNYDRENDHDSYYDSNNYD